MNNLSEGSEVNNLLVPERKYFHYNTVHTLFSIKNNLGT